MGLMGYDATAVNTVAKSTELLCDLQRTSKNNMLTISNFVYNTGTTRLLQQMGLVESSPNQPPPHLG